MNSVALELALKKQRLQIESEVLRADFGRHAGGLRPVFAGGDLAVDAAYWLRRHPEVGVAVLVALLVAKPSRIWRWGRRAFLGWQAWRKLQLLLQRRAPG